MICIVITLDTILESILIREIGLQFSKKVLSLSFFSIRVITACF